MSEDESIENATIISLDFTIVPGAHGAFSEESIDRIVQACYEAVKAEGYGSYTPEEGEEDPHSSLPFCKICKGTGLDLVIPPELVCPTCEGYGSLEPDNGTGEECWTELYGQEKLKSEPSSAEEILEAVGITEEQKEKARQAVEKTHLEE